VYDESDPLYVLDQIPLEWSGNGYGDYRYCPAELRMTDGSFSHDFIYQSHEIFDGVAPMDSLPGAIDESNTAKTLKIELKDEASDVCLTLFYTVFYECNVIVRRVALTNNCEAPLEIRRLLSMILDIPDRDYKLLTFDGDWIKEAHLHKRPISRGMYVNASNTGASSNRHNPGFIIADSKTDEDSGFAFGINLVYSGNHFGFVERDSFDKIRAGIGINPHCFSWTLEKGESFETPEAIISCSEKGFNSLSHNFHDFINEHIVRGGWKGKERPVLLNNWEAHFFKFTRRKLVRLAGGAARLGVELFVLDDGWFGKRNSDKAGLGDYNVNKKKLPGGIRSFSKKIHKLGMDFGLWFEPEMVNVDSDLFRAHPEYAACTPKRRRTMGRNQLVLDLTNPEVRDYIVENVGRVMDEAEVNYVKWDMNRHMSDVFSPMLKNQGEFCHKYILGLYDILNRIFYTRPHVLLESCSSGGNRFDLGMLCYSPQIWTSDDTDPVVRQKIQGGLSYLYPISVMGAHVSESPHQQTLRQTLLATRFNTACFGILGYELDLKYLTRMEKKEVADQIAFYKKHRRLIQFGRFSRIRAYRKNQKFWQVTSEDKTTAITGFFQDAAETSTGFSILRVKGLDPDKNYVVKTKPQRVFIKRFGGLVKHILPVELNPDGIILRIANKYKALGDCAEHYSGDGKLLSNGIFLNNQFMGSHYTPETELLGDFGSLLFVTEESKTN
jgi:alpha-galactosidase